MSIAAGLQEPFTPLSEIVERAGTEAPAQIVSVLPMLNVGMVLAVTVTVNVVELAHCPEAGVNVYTPDAWLSTVAGLHVPVIPFDDVVGNAGTVPPSQMVRDVPKLNAGVILGDTVTVNVVPVAQMPAAGENV